MLNHLDPSNVPELDTAIIIPTFNRAAQLERVLASLLSAININTSLIILDNCSTDETLHIVESFAGQNGRNYIFYYRHHFNVGAAQNFRLAFRIGNMCNYFFVMSDDDLIDSDFFNEAFSLARESQNCPFIYPSFTLDPGNGTLISYQGDNISYLDAAPYTRLKNYISLPSSNSIFYCVREGSGKSPLKEPRSIGSDIYMTMHSLINRPGLCLDNYTMHRSLKNWSAPNDIRRSDINAFQAICRYPQSFFEDKHYYAHKLFDMMSNLWLAMASMGASSDQALQLQSLYRRQISPGIDLNIFRSLLLLSLSERKRILSSSSELMKCSLAEAYLVFLND